MKTSGFSIDHIANLARLNLTDEEKALFGTQLEHVLSYVDQLQAIDTEGLAETAQVTGLEDVLRDDVVESLSLSERRTRRAELLAAAPVVNKAQTLIEVPAILGGTDE